MRKCFSEDVYTIGDHEGTLQIKFDRIGMKIELILPRSGRKFGTLRFDKKSSFNTLLGFTPYWDVKPNNAIHADSPGVYTIDKISILSTIDKIHFRCDVIDDSVAIGLRQPSLYSFSLDKHPGYKVFCQPETIE